MPTSLSVATFKASKYNADRSEKVWSNNQYVQNPYFATEDYDQHDSKERFTAAFEPRFNFTSWLYLKGRMVKGPVLMVGNNYAVRAQSGRYDAGRGLLMVGQNKNPEFAVVNNTGFHAAKDA